MISNIFIEQIERFKVQFCTNILSSNSKLPKCGFAVFCDTFTAQVDTAMTIKKTIYCAALVLIITVNISDASKRMQQLQLWINAKKQYPAY